jgi:hypothetical protein
VDRPLPWLRYIDADDLDAGSLELDGMKVREANGTKLGSVDGFVVDVDSGRPYYAVVDSGGWFKSKHFLLPIGHVRLDDDRDALVADVSKDRIDRFPGFELGRFEKLSEDELRAMNDAICGACSITTITFSDTAPLASAWQRDDYRQPDWWSSGGA